jgi:uncharacterized membrane protein YesL
MKILFIIFVYFDLLYSDDIRNTIKHADFITFLFSTLIIIAFFYIINLFISLIKKLFDKFLNNNVK